MVHARPLCLCRFKQTGTDGNGNVLCGPYTPTNAGLVHTCERARRKMHQCPSGAGTGTCARPPLKQLAAQPRSAPSHSLPACRREQRLVQWSGLPVLLCREQRPGADRSQ